jgi:uncharacterized protein YjeT (DUF2065 family)
MDQQQAAAILAAEQLTIQLRTVLRTHFATTPALPLAIALLYELTSMAATLAPTEATAIALIHAWADLAENQIRAFGVGQPHP